MSVGGDLVPSACSWHLPWHWDWGHHSLKASRRAGLPQEAAFLGKAAAQMPRRGTGTPRMCQGPGPGAARYQHVLLVE